MKHVIFRLVLLTTILVISTALIASAGIVNKEKGAHRATRATSSVLAYAFADESHSWPAEGTAKKGILPLGSVSVNSFDPSPGIPIGYTWYDYQQNCSMGRMIETGPHSGNTASYVAIHMSFMFLPEPVLQSRSFAYTGYSSYSGNLIGPVVLHDPDKQYSGYVNIDVTPDNRAIVGGHCDELTGATHYMPQMHFDGGPTYATFPNFTRVPDSLAAYTMLEDDEAMWPKFFMQFGTDTVLHVISMNWDYKASIQYFRCVGFEGDGEWDYPPRIVDTTQNSAHDITGMRTGDKLAIAWNANLPYQEPWCDTCSGITVYDEYLLGQMDNDVYYQISDDQGVTWNPRVNITKAPIGEAAYKNYPDLSILFDSNEDLHIVWNGTPWPADLCVETGGWCFTDEVWIDPCRIFHYSENVPYIRTIADHTYLQADSCGPPHFWSVTAGKMSISECDGNLYCMWGQFHDIPNGIDDDCAEWGFATQQWDGAANAELWVSVSSDGGMTWDRQRNLTNSYTPHCEPIEGEDCQSDYWGSMNRYGRQVGTGEVWTGVDIVDPSGGSYAGDYYLDIQYVNDLDAGGAAFPGDGNWTLNPIKWFRMPCIDPIPNPIFTPEWTSYGDPNYCKPGESNMTSLMIENIGNSLLTYSVSVEEDNGTPGWLSIADFSGSLPSGLAGMEIGTITLNANLMTTSGNYFGRLHFEGNDPYKLPMDIEIELIIADTIMWPKWDTVNTSCLSLAVSNYGNMGHDGEETNNMDYYGVDCDTTAQVYLYDGSPIIGRVTGTDTLISSSIWNSSFTADYSFRPLGEQIVTKTCGALNAEIYHSGAFTVQDSTIGLEKIWVAPMDNCEFIIEYLRVWSFDGGAHDGLTLGEAIDWDIPTDFLPEDTGFENTAANTGGVDPTRALVYQQGFEAYGDGADTLYPFNCQDNDARFGGNAFVESYLNGAYRTDEPYGGYVGENDSTQDNYGFFPGRLYYLMAQPGFAGTDSTEDLHTVLTYEHNFDLGASDVYEAVTVIATVHEGTLSDLQAAIDAGKAWYVANGGMDLFVDEDDIPGIDVCITCCAHMGNFYQTDAEGNPLPPSELELNAQDIDDYITWNYSGGRDPDCFDEVDPDGSGDPSAADIDYLIAYLYQSGPDPAPCP